MVRKYELTEREAELAFKQVSSHCSALKNHIASAVEGSKFDYAEELVKELREYQNLYAKLNVSADRMIEQWQAGTMSGGAVLKCSNTITAPWRKGTDDNPWSLYSTMRGWQKAHDSLESAWNKAKSAETRTDAYAIMDLVMTKFRRFGAFDTEPRAELRVRLNEVFGCE